MAERPALDFHVVPHSYLSRVQGQITDPTEPNFLHDEVGVLEPLDYTAQKILRQSLSH